jgi:hypothetical protein
MYLKIHLKKTFCNLIEPKDVPKDSLKKSQFNQTENFKKTEFNVERQNFSLSVPRD